MSKYLVHASYTPEGVKGLLKEGGKSRFKLVQDMTVKLGGKIDCFYYCFGETDLVAISDLPDDATAAAISMTINASGAVHMSVTPLLTPDLIDEAAKKSVEFRSPGK